MTAREHIADFHRKAAEHHGEVAKSHARLAECYKTLHKESGMGEKESPHSTIAAEHSHLSEMHKTHSEYHEQAAQGSMKAMDNDLNKVIPDRVSGITPDNPHYKAVTRTGQREIPNAAGIAAPVDLELEKVLESVE